MEVVYYRAPWRTFKPTLEKGKKKYNRKFLRKCNFLASYFSYISERNILKSKSKETHSAKYSYIFWNEIFQPQAWKTLIFQKGTCNPEKQTKKSALENFLVSYDIFAISTAVKHREIPCEAEIHHRDITIWIIRKFIV